MCIRDSGGGGGGGDNDDEEENYDDGDDDDDDDDVPHRNLTDVANLNPKYESYAETPTFSRDISYVTTKKRCKYITPVDIQ